MAPRGATIDLLFMLGQQNPKSRHLNGAYGDYMLALNPTGASGKIPALAEKGLSNYHIGRRALDRGRALGVAKSSEPAAAIRGPIQQQAWTNAHLMKTEAAKMVARNQAARRL